MLKCCSDCSVYVFLRPQHEVRPEGGKLQDFRGIVGIVIFAWLVGARTANRIVEQSDVVCVCVFTGM